MINIDLNNLRNICISMIELIDDYERLRIENLQLKEEIKEEQNQCSRIQESYNNTACETINCLLKNKLNEDE